MRPRTAAPGNRNLPLWPTSSLSCIGRAWAGRSSDLQEGFGTAGFADGLATPIETLGLGPAHIAGLSWGGTVALLAAITADVRPATLGRELGIMAETDLSDLLRLVSVPTC